MNEAGSVLARHYRTGKGVKLTWRRGVIETLEAAPCGDAVWLAPALTDLQVNGYAAVAFGASELSSDGLLEAVRALHRDGCAQFCPTLTTSEWSFIIGQLRRMRGWREADPELRHAIAGWHIEGPFLSPVDGFRGAHPADKMVSPTVEHIRELRAVTGDDPVLLTVAPEQPGALAVIAAAARLGIRVSLGHTNASSAEIAAAVRAGAISFTHLGNGCPQALDRHDNIVWRAVEAVALRVGLIPDSIHVSPPLFRILHRAIDPRRFWYTTDAVHPAGALPGRFSMLGAEFEVGPDQVVRKPGASNFAGSALRPLEGIFRAADMLGCPWRKVWDRYALQPRRLMGLDTRLLRPGRPADFCLLNGASAAEPIVHTHISGSLRSTLPARGWMRSAGIPQP